MRIDVITIFPELFESPLDFGIIRKARAEGIVTIRCVNLRDYCADRHLVTDDRPYGGGPGMVMKPEPLVRAITSIRQGSAESSFIMLTPRGRVFTQRVAEELAARPHLVLICGRYEGVDERVNDYIDDQISLGDFILTGGEPAAMVFIDAVTRLLPGALGGEGAADMDSFSEGLLEHPHYTRPREFNGRIVPEILLNGNHAEIVRWRRRESLRLTHKHRPDLLAKADLTPEERAWVETLVATDS
ncbi:MAG: tRNA (guanosine(37)-N1)-methyltransferase TrmD [Deltaproteobacteria bacterium]|nr:tRNA (guanosine(37)-N1)-methyltransferase TrmD [Deltaproteobacteria bacterium]